MDKVRTDRLKEWDTILKIVVSIAGIIIVLLISPLLSYIDRNNERLNRIEHHDLPQIKDEQNELRVHLMRINTRLEAQTEIIKKIADDVEYIRRKVE